MFNISDGEVILVHFPTYAQVLSLFPITRDLSAIGCLKGRTTRAFQTLRKRRGNNRNESSRIDKPFHPIIFIPNVKKRCLLAFHSVHARLEAVAFPALLLLLLDFLAQNSA